MSKAVLISIRPKWCEKICSGEKIIEVRKTRPKLETPFKCYIYCTKDAKMQWWTGSRYSYADDHSHNAFDKCGNGKVIGEFICDDIYEIDPTKTIGAGFAEDSCVSSRDIHEYLGGQTGYGWHISDLKIYDTPKDLSKFSRPFENCIDKVCDEFGCASCEHGGHIKRPPKSWCYAEKFR